MRGPVLVPRRRGGRGSDAHDETLQTDSQASPQQALASHAFVYLIQKSPNLEGWSRDCWKRLLNPKPKTLKFLNPQPGLLALQYSTPRPEALGHFAAPSATEGYRLSRFWSLECRMIFGLLGRQVLPEEASPSACQMHVHCIRVECFFGVVLLPGFPLS